MAETAQRPRLTAPHGAGPAPTGSIAVTSSGEVIATAPTTSDEAAASGRFVRRLLLVALVVALVPLVWFAKEVLLLIFAGVLAAVFLCGLSDLVVSRVRIPRGVALTGILLALTGLFCLGTWFLGAELVEQFGELNRGLNDSVVRLREYLEKTPFGDLLRPRRQAASGDTLTVLSQVAGMVSSGIGILAAPLIVLIIGIYLAIDPWLYRRGLLALVPLERRNRVREILHQTTNMLWGWLLGRLFSMSLIGVTTYIGLWLLGVPMALSLGLIAFVTNFIPYLGPLLSAIPAVLMAYSSDGGGQVLWVLLLYAGIQLVETYLLTPLVEQRSVSLPPAFTLSTQLLSGVLLGGLGVIFATPLAATAVVLVKTLYVEDVLGDRPKEAGSAEG